MKKLIIPIILSMFFVSYLQAEETEQQTSEFPNYGLGGWVTSIRSDMLDDKHSPDLLNVDTDRYTGLITRRLGSVYFNSTALEGAKSIRNSHDYKQIDNDEYILILSSTSMFYSTGNGTFTKLRSNLNSSSITQFTTGKDTVYMVDGTTWPWKWNGTTATILDNKAHSGVTISTNTPTYPYFTAYWHNRLWYFRTDSEPSTAWYSNYYDPENIGALNYKYINVSDGDYITGVFLYKNRMIITKRYSTWEIVEITDNQGDPFFQIQNISETIGCLYQNTMREHLGFPMWLSHRGVEMYNGQFNLVSEPIDDYVKSLSQLTLNKQVLYQDSASDWGKGYYFHNIDTVTSSGSISISSGTEAIYDSYFDFTSATEGGYTVVFSTRGKVNGGDWSGAYSSGAFSDDTTKGLVIATRANYDPGAGVDDDYIYISTNIFTSWRKYATKGDYSLPKISNDGSRMFVMKRNTASPYRMDLLISTNAFVNVTTKHMKANSSAVYDVSEDGRYILIGSTKCYVSADYGNTFTAKNTYVSGGYEGVWVNPDGSEMYASYISNGYVVVSYSNNFGVIWSTKTSSGFPSAQNASSISGFKCSNNILYATLYIGTLSQYKTYKSANKGSTWTEISAIRNYIIYDTSEDGNASVYKLYTGTRTVISYDNASTFTQVAVSTFSSLSPINIKRFGETIYYFYTNTISSTSVVIKNTNSIVYDALNAGSSWGSWGNFIANETKPSGTNITYYGQFGTTALIAKLATKIALTNNSAITSTDGAYFIITSSLTSNLTTSTPLLNSYNIEYQTTSSAYPPYAIDYNDKYYLAVSTDTPNTGNNLVLVYQRNGEWTRYNGTGMNWGSAFTYKGNLYSCDSRDTGRVYKQDVNSYDDNGSAYESYWTSKIFNFGGIRKTTILDLCPLFNNAGNWNINIQYRMHGSNGAWTTKTLNLYDSTYGLITKIIPLSFPKSYFFQYRIQEDDIDESFEYRGMTIRSIVESIE